MFNDMERRVFIQGVPGYFALEAGNPLNDAGIISFLTQRHPNIPTDVALVWTVCEETDANDNVVQYKKATIVPRAQTKG